MGKAEMKKEPASVSAISEAALKVFTREELTQMPRPLRLSLMNLIGNRLDESHKPPPTVAELEGIKELLLEHLWCPAFTAAPGHTND